MGRYEVSDIGFEPDGTALITYMERTDVRCEGQVAVRHTARIVPSPQYAEGIQRLVDAATHLLGDALDDWSGSDPVVDMAQERPLPAEAGGGDELEPAEPDELESETARRNWDAVESAQLTPPTRPSPTRSA